VAVIAALEGLKAQSDLDMTRILLAGQSAGGDTVMYMSTLALEGVKGVINFAGGRANHSTISSATFENRMMISGWESLGKQAIHPALLIFAENDSRYSANTIRKSAQAFIDGGGKAELALFPPITGDGHFIHTRSDLWLPSMTQFLKKLGVVP
jgi:dienelactone hydrolase